MSMARADRRRDRAAVMESPRRTESNYQLTCRPARMSDLGFSEIPEHVRHLVCCRRVQQIEKSPEQITHLLAAHLSRHHDPRVMAVVRSPFPGEHDEIGNVEADETTALG